MKNKNYLINELENGRDLSIYLISHNAYHSNFQILPNHYKNCKVEVSGECGFKRWSNDMGEDADLIFYYSSGYFDEDDLDFLEQKIVKISEEKQKRVSLGYSYLIREEDRADKNNSDKMIIISYKDGIKDETDVDLDSLLNPLSIAQIILETADEFDNQKTKRKDLF